MATTTAKKKTKKASSKKVTKATTPQVPAQPEDSDIDREVAEGFFIRLSESLKVKIKDLAEDEGLSEEEFLAEIVAEGVVVRAYDQWERRQHMRGGGTQGLPGQQGQGNSGQSQRRGNRGNRGNRRSNHKRYQTLMEDNSSFLEYVRNQEKKGNR